MVRVNNILLVGTTW